MKRTACLCLMLAACVQTTTTDKLGNVTTTKAPAPGVLPFAAAAIVAYSPRPIVVREEKSGDVNEINFVNIKPLSGSPITTEEIYRRSGAYGPDLPKNKSNKPESN